MVEINYLQKEFEKILVEAIEKFDISPEDSKLDILMEEDRLKISFLKDKIDLNVVFRTKEELERRCDTIIDADISVLGDVLTIYIY
jgi:hypothetical protein